MPIPGQAYPLAKLNHWQMALVLSGLVCKEVFHVVESGTYADRALARVHAFIHFLEKDDGTLVQMLRQWAEAGGFDPNEHQFWIE